MSLSNLSILVSACSCRVGTAIPTTTYWSIPEYNTQKHKPRQELPPCIKLSFPTHQHSHVSVAARLGVLNSRLIACPPLWSVCCGTNIKFHCWLAITTVSLTYEHLFSGAKRGSESCNSRVHKFWTCNTTTRWIFTRQLFSSLWAPWLLTLLPFPLVASRFEVLVVIFIALRAVLSMQ